MLTISGIIGGFFCVGCYLVFDSWIGLDSLAIRYWDAERGSEAYLNMWYEGVFESNGLIFRVWSFVLNICFCVTSINRIKENF